MAITSEMRTEVAQLYVALFGRAPDGEGLGFWTQLRDQGRSMADIANIMFATEPARVYYPSFLSNQEIIGAFYTNVLGRPADAEGLAFWTAKLNAPGATFGTVVAEMIAVVNAYAGTAEPSKSSHDLFVNRVNVAQYYGEHNGTVEGANAVLVGVTKDAATVASMKAAIDNGTVPGVNQGQTFVLTVNQDFGTAFTGGSGNDTFVANAAQDGNGLLVSTLQSVDMLDGGAGSDTLVLTLVNPGTVTPTLRNIETMVYRAVENNRLDLAGATGVGHLIIEGSTATPTVANFAAIPALTLRDKVGGTVILDGAAPSAATLSLTVDHFGRPGSAATLDMGGSAAPGTVTLDLTCNNSNLNLDSSFDDRVKHLRVHATGNNILTLEDSDSTIEDVVVTGSGQLDLGNFFHISSFDATASTADIFAFVRTDQPALLRMGSGADFLSLNAVAAGLGASMGAGDDVIQIRSGMANMDGGLDGGAGRDILALEDGAQLTAATAKFLSGIEVLDIAGGQGTYDLALAAFEQVGAGAYARNQLNDDVTIANAPDNFSFHVTTLAKNLDGYSLGKALTIQGKDYAGTTANGNAETFTLVANINDGQNNGVADGNIVVPTLDIAGVEQLVLDARLATRDADPAVQPIFYFLDVSDVIAPDLERLVIKGNAYVQAGSKLSNMGSLSQVDASANSVGLGMNLNNHGRAVAIIGSSGKDIYDSSTHGDTIYLGAGGDEVYLAAGGADTLIYKQASDSQLSRVTPGPVTFMNILGADQVEGFDSAEGDRVDLTSFGFEGARRGIASVEGRFDAQTDLTRLVDWFSQAGLDRGVATGHVSGYLAVFVDVNKDGDFSAADDMVILLNGVAALGTDNISF